MLTQCKSSDWLKMHTGSWSFRNDRQHPELNITANLEFDLERTSCLEITNYILITLDKFHFTLLLLTYKCSMNMNQCTSRVTIKHPCLSVLNLHVRAALTYWLTHCLTWWMSVWPAGCWLAEWKHCPHIVTYPNCILELTRAIGEIHPIWAVAYIKCLRLGMESVLREGNTMQYWRSQSTRLHLLWFG